MQTKLKGFWERIKGFFAKLNKKTRILLGVCAVVVLVLILAAALLLNRGEKYEVLCTNLTASETSSVINFLNENGVTDYRISNDKILVPAERADQLHIQLISSNLLNTGFLYEFYTDNTSNFSTEAERKEAVRIATEQKLEAVIRQFDGVRSATVEIALGTDRNYVLQSSATPSTAAVTITPDGNRQLSAGVVESIRYTVSHSVRELNIGDVSIVDTNGNNYNDTGNSTGAMVDANAMQLQYEQTTNNKVRNEVLRALERIYGEGNVTVAVNTKVDVSRKVVESTEYAQPAGAVEGGGLIGQETWFWEYGTDGTINMGGTVGAGPNTDVITYPTINGTLGNDTNLAGASGDRKHMIDTTVTQKEVLAGTITDVSVAVTINQNAPNAESLSIERLTSHVAIASGIGTNLENWDSHVSVVIAPFADTQPVGPSDPTQPPAELIPGIPNWIILAALGGLLLFIILLIIILILRSRRKKKRAARMAAEAELREAEEAAAAEAAAAAIIAAAPTGGADIMEVNTEKSMELRKTVRQFAQNNPEIAAQMVKAWLKGDESGA